MKFIQSNLIKLGVAYAESGKMKCALEIAPQMPPGEARDWIYRKVVDYDLGRMNFDDAFRRLGSMTDGRVKAFATKAILDCAVEGGRCSSAYYAAKLLGRKLVKEELSKIVKVCVQSGALYDTRSALRLLGRKLTAKELKTAFDYCVSHGCFVDGLNIVRFIPGRRAKNRLLKISALRELARCTAHDTFFQAVGLMSKGRVRNDLLLGVIRIFIGRGESDDVLRAAGLLGRKLNDSQLSRLAKNLVRKNDLPGAAKITDLLSDRRAKDRMLKSVCLAYRMKQEYRNVFDLAKLITSAKTRGTIVDDLIAGSINDGDIRLARAAALSAGRDLTDGEVMRCFRRIALMEHLSKTAREVLGFLDRELTDQEVQELVGK